jgi:hypothetical protein
MIIKGDSFLILRKRKSNDEKQLNQKQEEQK